MSPSIPEWRRASSPQSDNKDDNPASWRARRTQSASPTRPHERFERVKSLESDWRAGEERRVPEARRQGEARTMAQRMADRGARDEQMKQLYTRIVFPAEPERVALYHSLKKNTNHIITFLVEAVHGAGKNLPQEIIKQHCENKYDCKYKVHVNHLVTLAERIVHSLETKARGIAANLDLLDVTIDQRMKYSHCMYQIVSNENSNNEHAHFIDILEDVRTILSHYLQSKTTKLAEPVTKPLQRNTSTLGKRPRAISPQRDAEQNKAIKTVILTSSLSSSSLTPLKKPMYNLRSGGTAAKQGTNSASMPKMSWAAVAAVGA